MAVKWHVIAKYPNGQTTSVKFATDTGKDNAVATLLNMGCVVTIVDLTKLAEDYPRVPTIEECERELYRAWALNNEAPEGGVNGPSSV